ncbi:hypothetical protein DDB_G0281417 [Dictyostelium discoideum AX4]|uniref:Transmembrane protein n=1 Tax=Dictyostelium discoideum TaxID=44689 RepID=Q54TZ9_DICDI|nr:hypothetical protein DDB_G0281417 [Dictyostelium discoideum AX4]EAL66690.1 hypothetical protein DDB_G0281417 [Dictyostelium discoideum AX4]|eukprot:XP_640662.1 hypothetical protein DDB_G0281417 [Dictyostelium discoideum AX4]
MENNSNCNHCQTIIKEIRKQDNVNLQAHEKQPNDVGTIKYRADQAGHWRGAFNGFDYIIFGVAVGAFSNINMSYFWATILTIGLNFFILLGRQALMWEYDLKKLDGKLSIDASYFNALAPVDSVYGNKRGVLIVVIIGIITCTAGLVEQARIYKDSFQTPYFYWEPSPDFQLNPIFNMFAMNLLNLFCAFLSLYFYFKLTGCVSYEFDVRGQKSLFFYSPCIGNRTVIINNGNNNQNQGGSISQTNNNTSNQPIYYHPNKLELVMILLDKKHLNIFARECRANHVYLELEFDETRGRRICGIE